MENVTEINAAAKQQPAGEEAAGQQTEKTFTQEELNEIVSQRLGREREKLEKDFKAELDKQLTEAQKLAKMTAEQKAEYERQRHLEELARREADITRRELMAAAKDTLSGKGLPLELAEILNYADADTCGASMEKVQAAFEKAVTKTVNDRLRQELLKEENAGRDIMAEMRRAAGAAIIKGMVLIYCL